MLAEAAFPSVLQDIASCDPVPAPTCTTEAPVPVPLDFGSLKSTSALDTGGAVDDADAEEGVKSPLSVLLDDEEALVRCPVARRGYCRAVQGSMASVIDLILSFGVSKLLACCLSPVLVSLVCLCRSMSCCRSSGTTIPRSPALQFACTSCGCTARTTSCPWT